MAPQPDAAPTGQLPEEQPFVVRVSMFKRLACLFATGTVVIVLCFGTVAGVGVVTSNGPTLAMPVVILTGIGLVLALLIVSPIALVLPRPVLLALGPDGMWISTGRSQEPFVWAAWATVGRMVLRRWPLHWELHVQTDDPGSLRTVALWGVDCSVKEVRAALARYAPDAV